MLFYTLVLGQLSTNCYICADEDTKNALVIDVPDEAEKILSFAEEKGIKITDIILTHGHFDHILALKKVKDKTGAKLSIFEKTERFLCDPIYNLAQYMNKKIVPVEADRILKDGDVFDFYGTEFKIIHTPGHTEDSICLLCGDTLFSGDTLFKQSIGRWDHPTGDVKEELASVKNRLMNLADDTKVCPGHGETTTIGDERKGNMYIQ